ncbi:MAG: ankyrin repeat domain-containing protein [Planctomycetia bacterium]|nr:ankyrin repeat domain-containing protein [Planctomycetia bacterium]
MRRSETRSVVGILTFLFLCLPLVPAFPIETGDNEDVSRLFNATRKGDLEEVRYCVETLKLPINEEDGWIRETPLMFVAESGNVELVKYMIAHGARPDLSTDCDEGCTNVAMYAIRSKNLEMVRYFVEVLYNTSR